MAITLLLPPPPSMPGGAWVVAGLVCWMAAWWMTEAIPLTATALLPFLVLPFAGVGTPNDVASDYYSPILFLILGGAFLALAIERTGLHKRLAVFVLDLVGSKGGPLQVMLAFMVSAAVLSNIISNTSTALIMMPMAAAVLAGGGAGSDQRLGLPGALPMAIAFAASIGGLGTIIGSPTNAIGVALLRETAGVQVSFALWSAFGLPIVVLGIPLAALIIGKVQRVADHPFDTQAARAAIAPHGPWTTPERRLVPVIALAFVLWMARPLLEPLLPPGSLTDGTIAVFAGLALFLLPDGTGRRLLNWEEANRAPWGVILMFGGGLALAAAMSRSGLDTWLGQALLPLAGVPLVVVALAVVAMVVLITEFASNVATASGVMPVIASLTVALGADPLLLGVPAAMAASWGFMLPSGTGPNAIAWATGRIDLPRMVGAGALLDLAGVVLIVGSAWAVYALMAAIGLV
ncbi:SLC13 family permease [Altererythrobacter sp. B11]|uniref:SLC13 family permease n=1 Tax=Altererythrobacter sp. B11 TaxID=2060312 RepID=UPI000E5B4EB6|nr:DASS family sodium-coupled anion symporter [Altererythrobacter sp. B11]